VLRTAPYRRALQSACAGVPVKEMRVPAAKKYKKKYEEKYEEKYAKV